MRRCMDGLWCGALPANSRLSTTSCWAVGRVRTRGVVLSERSELQTERRELVRLSASGVRHASLRVRSVRIAPLDGDGEGSALTGVVAAWEADVPAPAVSSSSVGLAARVASRVARV